MKFVLWAGGLASLAVGGWMAAHIVPASGAFQTLEPVLVDQCRRIDVAPGTEDVEIDEANGVAFISTADRRAWFAMQDGPRPRGAIFALAVGDPDAKPELVSDDAPADFSPHGISLWTAPDGARRLFVVSHHSDGREVVEIFDVAADNRLTHAESVSFDAMYSPNDVVAVGARAFYATNDRRHESGVLGQLEGYLALPLTSLAYFDGESGRTITEGLTYANGVNVSADGETVFVAELLKRRVTVFDRDLPTGALTRKRFLRLPTAPDNIDVGPDGALWIGGHTRIFDFLKHAEDPAAVAPSHVVRVDPETGETATVFVSIDGEINASSVGAYGLGVLMVGAVFDGHVLACPVTG